jgi:SAM-dependent methyltransferase
VLAGDLRGIFDEDPELYAQARPEYPTDLIDDHREFAQLGPGSQLVEIGPGTGQATAALASHGASVLAVELGAALAAVLKRKLSGASVEVVVSAFEDWPLPGQPFDLLVAFNSWHWLDPAVRTTKAAAALRPGGMLATVASIHVAGGTEEFFTRAQQCYERWDPATTPDLHLLAADEVAPAIDEADLSEWFAPAVRHRYPQEVVYSTRGYLDLLATYSGHRALAPERREGLFDCIGGLIDNSFGGSITKRYLYELRLARRRLNS